MEDDIYYEQGLSFYCHLMTEITKRNLVIKTHNQRVRLYNIFIEYVKRVENGFEINENELINNIINRIFFGY